MPERKVGLLTIKNIRRVAFVERGANPHAHIALLKSADVDPENAPPERREAPVSQSQVMQKIEKAADHLRVKDASLTREQAISRVMDAHADLVDEYRKAEPDFNIEEPKEPEPTDVQKADADVVSITKSHGEDSREYAVAMAKRLTLLGHDEAARDWESQAAFIG